MEIKTQFTIALWNKPGTLKTLCKKLSGKKVNIEAISIVNTQEMGMIRLVTSNMTATSTALKGFNSAKEKVLMVQFEDKPGKLGDIAGKLAEKEINIEYTYGSTSVDGNALLVFKVDDPEKAMKVLNQE